MRVFCYTEIIAEIVTEWRTSEFNGAVLPRAKLNGNFGSRFIMFACLTQLHRGATTNSRLRQDAGWNVYNISWSTRSSKGVRVCVSFRSNVEFTQAGSVFAMLREIFYLIQFSKRNVWLFISMDRLKFCVTFNENCRMLFILFYHSIRWHSFGEFNFLMAISISDFCDPRLELSFNFNEEFIYQGQRWYQWFRCNRVYFLFLFYATTWRIVGELVSYFRWEFLCKIWMVSDGFIIRVFYFQTELHMFLCIRWHSGSL